MSTTIQHFIDGKRSSLNSTRTADVFNPSTGEVQAKVLLASAADVDTAVKMGMGIRFPAWGPLEHVDTVGLDLCLSVQETVLPSLYNEPHATPLFHRLLDGGAAGVKAGKGFHDWRARSHADLVAERDRFLIQALKILGRGRPVLNPKE